MKKLFTSALIALSMFAATASFTASASNDLKINAQAAVIARQMVNEVQLNESEYIRVKEYTAEKLERMAQIRTMYSNDPAMMASKIAEAENNYSHNIQAILNPSQFEKYVAFVERNSNTAVAGNQE